MIFFSLSKHSSTQTTATRHFSRAYNRSFRHIPKLPVRLSRCISFSPPPLLSSCHRPGCDHGTWCAIAGSLGRGNNVPIFWVLRSGHRTHSRDSTITGWSGNVGDRLYFLWLHKEPEVGWPSSTGRISRDAGRRPQATTPTTTAPAAPPAAPPTPTRTGPRSQTLPSAGGYGTASPTAITVGTPPRDETGTRLCQGM